MTWGAIRSHPHIARLCWLGLKNKRNLFKLCKCHKRKQTELAVFMLSAWGGIFSLQCYTKRKRALRHIPSRAPAAQQRFCRLFRDVNVGTGPFSQSRIHSLPWARTKLPKTDRAVPKSPNPTLSQGAASLSGEASLAEGGSSEATSDEDRALHISSPAVVKEKAARAEQRHPKASWRGGGNPLRALASPRPLRQELPASRGLAWARAPWHRGRAPQE